MKEKVKVQKEYDIKEQKEIYENSEKYPSGKYILRRPDGSRKVVTINREPSLADQSFKSETDVNNILSKYKKMGIPLPVPTGQFADVSNVSDAITMLERIQENFLQIPAHIRKLFNNDPGQLEKYLMDPKNDEKAIELGLKIKPENTDQSPGQVAKPAGTNDVGGGSGSQKDSVNSESNQSNKGTD
jgi:hypothetical protein